MKYWIKAEATASACCNCLNTSSSSGTGCPKDTAKLKRFWDEWRVIKYSDCHQFSEVLWNKPVKAGVLSYLLTSLPAQTEPEDISAALGFNGSGCAEGKEKLEDGC